ncbi:hypothetical protein ACPA9J_15190 [Pseudomonas aeruginosa]
MALTEDALSRSYREWEYCVQYRERPVSTPVSRLDGAGRHLLLVPPRVEPLTSWCSPTPTARNARACRTTPAPGHSADLEWRARPFHDWVHGARQSGSLEPQRLP